MLCSEVSSKDCPTTSSIFRSWLEISKKDQKLRNKFWKTLFEVGVDLKKVQKQGRDETMQVENPTRTSAVYFFANVS